MPYIIVSLKHGTGERPWFWQSDNCGYTQNPFLAGHYEDEVVESQLGYYNDGYNTIAVKLEDIGKLGLRVTYDEKAIDQFLTRKSKSDIPSTL